MKLGLFVRAAVVIRAQSDGGIVNHAAKLVDMRIPFHPVAAILTNPRGDYC
jgi:hypothetical protein